MARFSVHLGLAAIGLLLASCSSTRPIKSVGQIYSAPEVEAVTVVSRSAERIPASRGRISGQVASVAGGYGGGIVGSMVGGILGPAVETAVVKRTVSNYTLRRTDGSRVTLMQNDAHTPLRVGRTAYLVRDGHGQSRLVATRPAS